MLWLIGFGVTVRDTLRVKILEKVLSQQKYGNPIFLRFGVFLMVAQNPIIHNIL